MANTLTVEFHYMFLLVRKLHRPGTNKLLPKHVALLPNGNCEHRLTYPHQVRWSIGGDDVISPDGDFRFLSATGATAPTELLGLAKLSRPVKLPNLLHMKEVPGSGTNGAVRPELLRRSPFPRDLGARVWMPSGGRFTAFETVANQAPPCCNVTDYGTACKKNLTDKLVYEFPLTKNVTYFLEHHPRGGVPELHTLGTNRNINVVFTNDEAAGAPPPIDWRVFEDFAEMYRLCTSNKNTRWPVPVLDISEVKRAKRGIMNVRTSDPERPICGGGQGCDPNVDPKCP